MLFSCGREIGMATKRNRPDQNGWAEASFKKAKKIIFARDRVCGICGRPVDMDKGFPDPWSPTVDHIIPISKGGDPCALDNLQLAHLQCNRVKKAKILAPQLKEKSVSNRDLPLSTDWSVAT